MVEAPEPGEIELQPGQALLAVDKFAFTSNNVTYGVFGEAMGYWKFFPAPDGWGRIPVWGFADVIRSENGDVSAGERVFGYLPMSTHLVVQPDRVTDGGFTDASEHRAELPGAYQQYTRVSGTDADRKYEDHLAILQPLFMTSFLIEDFLADSDLFGRRRPARERLQQDGTGSRLPSGEEPAVELRDCRIDVSRQCRVLRKGRLLRSRRPIPRAQSLSGDPATVFVDMAGDGKVLKAVHGHFGDNLKYSCIVGATHWEDREAPGDLPGPAPQFFFAPTQLVARRQEWGAEVFADRYGEARGAFLPSADAWMKIVHDKGPEAVKDVYLAMVDGKVDPQVGQMLSLSQSSAARPRV